MQTLNMTSPVLIEPKYGSEISVIVNGVSHPGIYVGNWQVIDNSKKRGGVYRSPLEEFRGGRDLSYNGFKGSVSPEKVVENAYAAIGTRYDFLFYNCKDFVRHVRGDALLSMLIKTAVIGAVAYTGYQIARRA